LKFKTAHQLQNQSWDTIVVGSGMGGLATAALLSLKGERVLVVEQHYQPGGFTHTFKRKGFEWDVGVHCVGDLKKGSPTRNMFDVVTEGRLQWQSFGDVYETFRFGSEEPFYFSSQLKQFRQDLMERFPQDKESLKRFFKRVDLAVKRMPLYYASKVLPNRFMRVLEFLKLGAYRDRQLTTQEVARECGISQHCQDYLLGQWGYYGELPCESSFALHAMVSTHFSQGAYFPVGGAASIFKSIYPTIQKSQGEVIVRSRVKGFIWTSGRQNRVRGVTVESQGPQENDGSVVHLYAKRVFWAAGVQNLVKILEEDLDGDGKDSNTQLPASVSEWMGEIKTLRSSPAHVCLYLGFKGDIEKFGATRSSQWIYAEPGKNLDKNSGQNKDASVLEKYWKIHPDTDPSDLWSAPPVLFCSFPSVKDPLSVSPTGEVVTFVDSEVFKKWKNSRRGYRPKDYQEFKQKIHESLLNQFKSAFPDLAPLIVYSELSTPLSTEFFDAAPSGGIYGLEHTPRRMCSTALQVRTPISKLYLSGSDVSSGGVAGALSGGFLSVAALKPSLFKKMI
jgi:all-trans-retinol 13,14-reductase